MSQERYSEFVNTIRNKWNNDSFKGCGCEVRRTKNGWPDVQPEEMDDLQVLYEASRWVRTAIDTGFHTVGGSQWVLYANELIRRGLMDEDCRDRCDFLKILEKGWQARPLGPIVIDPVIAPPEQFDPNSRSFVGRTARALTRALRRILPKP